MNNINAPILITGATGFIGQHLVQRFLADGKVVRILTRGTRSLPDDWYNHVEIIKGDLTDAKVSKEAVSDCSVVYHLAGELREHAKMRATNVEGTRCLLDACKQAEVTRIVYLSSVGVMGVDKPGLVDETASCHPKNPYEQSKYDAEKIALAWSAETQIPLVAIRPTNVFGDGVRNGRDSMLSWIHMIQTGRFIFFDRLAIANYVYVGDVVDACCQAGKSNLDGVLIVSDGCMLTDFVDAISELLGKPTQRHLIPLPMAKGLALLLQSMSWVMHRSNPLTLSRVRALSSRTRYVSARIHCELGWQPVFGYRVGLQRTIDWYRRIGQIQ